MHKLFSAIAVIGMFTISSANAAAHNDLVETETVYIAAGTTLHFQTSRPFSNVYVGGKALLTVQPGITNQDLNITANEPEGGLTGSANVLVVDENGRVVDNLRVEVTPFGGPAKTVTIFKGTDSDKTMVQYCRASEFSGGSSSCVDAPKTDKGMGDADSVSVTAHRDGSTTRTKSWSTPPQR